MIPVFDLDDTLYPELTFVHSGFNAVAQYLECNFGSPAADSFTIMLNSLASEGRGAVFDSLLKCLGLYSKAMVKRCISVYRNHAPNISLNTDATDLLANFGGPLFLVTDGNKMVQAKKVRALGLDPWFRRIFITHRFGIHNSKPSTHCFRLIHDSLNCDWSDMVYIGDNPAKDFVNLKPLGMKTVRILTGSYANVSAAPDFDADFHIDSLNEITDLFSLE